MKKAYMRVYSKKKKTYICIYRKLAGKKKLKPPVSDCVFNSGRQWSEGRLENVIHPHRRHRRRRHHPPAANNGPRRFVMICCYCLSRPTSDVFGDGVRSRAAPSAETPPDRPAPWRRVIGLTRYRPRAPKIVIRFYL